MLIELLCLSLYICQECILSSLKHTENWAILNVCEFCLYWQVFRIKLTKTIKMVHTEITRQLCQQPVLTRLASYFHSWLPFCYLKFNIFVLDTIYTYLCVCVLSFPYILHILSYVFSLYFLLFPLHFNFYFSFICHLKMLHLTFLVIKISFSYN